MFDWLGYRRLFGPRSKSRDEGTVIGRCGEGQECAKSDHQEGNSFVSWTDWVLSRTHPELCCCCHSFNRSTEEGTAKQVGLGRSAGTSIRGFEKCGDRKTCPPSTGQRKTVRADVSDTAELELFCCRDTAVSYFL